MKKIEKNYSTLTLPLHTEIYQEHILEKRFNICRIIYNAMVNIVKKQINKLEHDLEYKENKITIKEIYKKINNTEKKIKETQNKIQLEKEKIIIFNLKNTLSDLESNLKALVANKKEICKNINNTYMKYNLTKYDMYKIISPIYKNYNSNIQSLIAQDISFRIWESVEKYLFGDGECIHCKKYGEIDTIASTSHSQIVYKNNYIHFTKLKMHPIIRNKFEQTILDNLSHNDIKLIQIKRKFVKNKYRYYATIIYEGTPISIIKKGNNLGNGNIGIDIGTQTVAIVSNIDVKLIELADRINNIEKEKRRLLRYMDRSKRTNNPNNFNEDGTIKKQGNKKVMWIKSKKYIKAQNKLKELYRKQADIRKIQHWELANEISKQGNIAYVEEMNFKALQKRSRKTEKSEKTGKFKKKKRFGKSLANKAPSMFLLILETKLKSLGGQLIKVNTKELKASQYNHIDNTYKKKSLSQRWNDLNGIKVQRDLYSAFLIQHVNEDLKSFNNKTINNDFNNFINLHNKTIEKIKVSKFYKLSSFGI